MHCNAISPAVIKTVQPTTFVVDFGPIWSISAQKPKTRSLPIPLPAYFLPPYFLPTAELPNKQTNEKTVARLTFYYIATPMPPM